MPWNIVLLIGWCVCAWHITVLDRSFRRRAHWSIVGGSAVIALGILLRMVGVDEPISMGVIVCGGLIFLVRWSLDYLRTLRELEQEQGKR